MCKIQRAVNHTPIEIALGIGSDGMTTARALYDFLELAKGQFSRWAKTNIVENPFAEENKDYVRFDIDVEGNKTVDYWLSANFAKKLSMQGKTEKAEQARNYFISIENKAKDMVLLLKQASSDPMKLLKLHYEALKQVDKKVEEVSGKVGAIEGRVKELEDTMNLDHGQQRRLEKAVNKTVISVLGGKESNAYKAIGRKVFCECNGNLKDYFGVNARGDVPRKRYEDALSYAEKWRPCTNTAMLIEQYNAQQTLDLEGGAC